MRKAFLFLFLFILSAQVFGRMIVNIDKPTEQRTRLRWSLSYDIIKAHNGEIKVESKEGEGTTFIIQLKAV